MKHFIPCLFLSLLLTLSCSSFAQKTSFKKSEPSSAVRKELEEAERKMWANIMKLDPAYFKNYVSEDYITINADGVMANKRETLSDSARKKMFEAVKNATIKFLDKRIRVYGQVGVITGRSQILMDNVLVVEFLFTQLWVKEKGKWMYTGWQGTFSKNSPPPPTMQ